MCGAENTQRHNYTANIWCDWAVMNNSYTIIVTITEQEVSLMIM